MKKVLGFLFLFFCSSVNAQLDSIVNEIAEQGELHARRIGIGGRETDQYRRYLYLKEGVTINLLLQLTEHESGVVKTYAALALIEKAPQYIPKIFNEFQETPLEIKTMKGCNISVKLTSSVLYYNYRSTISEVETDLIMRQLDSMVLFGKEIERVLYWIAFENRIYSKLYHSQIEQLAFEKGNLYAMLYLSKWYKANYREELKIALSQYLQQTNFGDMGASIYYEVVVGLLELKDEKIENIIVNKLKEDKTWERSRSRFIDLLFDHFIMIE
jgi:hypothetical protein